MKNADQLRIDLERIAASTSQDPYEEACNMPFNFVKSEAISVISKRMVTGLEKYINVFKELRTCTSNTRAKLGKAPDEDLLNKKAAQSELVKETLKNRFKLLLSLSRGKDPVEPDDQWVPTNTKHLLGDVLDGKDVTSENNLREIIPKLLERQKHKRPADHHALNNSSPPKSREHVSSSKLTKKKAPVAADLGKEPLQVQTARPNSTARSPTLKFADMEEDYNIKYRETIKASKIPLTTREHIEKKEEEELILPQLKNPWTLQSVIRDTNILHMMASRKPLLSFS